jgi:hypothetical protein
MTKQILLIAFLSFLIFIPAGKIGAAQYFVGVTIASGQAPGYPAGTTDTNWCLPYTTTMAIRNSSGTNLTAISPTVNPVTIPTAGCAGKTIWSGLVDLTSGTNYQIYVSIPTPEPVYCPGYAVIEVYTGDVSACWTSWNVSGQEKSCSAICSHYGLTYKVYNTSYSYNYQAANNCAIEGFLMGGTCSSCTTNATYNYYNPTTYACYSSTTYQGDANGLATLGTDLAKVCACNIQDNSTATAFTFTFTPSF